MTQHNLTPSHDHVALIVDDEPLILMDTADILSDAGYEVIEAHNADEALEILKQNSSLELLFTDIQMPGELDGVALAWYVAEHWPHINMIVASGALRAKAKALPQSALFLEKPVSPEVVLHAIDELATP
jgi:DNA-binding NtrC family response regulator